KAISKAKNRRISTRTVHRALYEENVRSYLKSLSSSEKKKTGIGLLQTGRKSYGRMNLLLSIAVALRKRNPQFSNVHELENAPPQKVYRNLILSMPSRIQSVIANY